MKIKNILLFIFLLTISLYAEDWSLFTSENSPLPDEGIVAIKVENSTKFWVGSMGYGIYCYSNGDWVHYDSISTGMPINSVYRIIIDESDNKWLGTLLPIIGGFGNGLIKFDGNVWSQYNMTNSNISGDAILSLEIDNEGLLWIGHENGVSTFDGQNWNNISLDSEFHHVSAISLKDYPNIWFGTNCVDEFGNPTGGFYSLNIQTNDFIKYTSQNSDLPHNYVFSIDVEENGKKWIATLGAGIASFDSDWNIFNTYNCELASNLVFDCLVENSESIWFATVSDSIQTGGVSHLFGNSWVNYNSSNSQLTSNQVYQIENDENGSKYFTTGNGVCILSIDSNINENNIQPTLFSISNFPNPFNPETTISYNLPTSGKTEVNIYNIKGQFVKQLVNEVQASGQHSVTWSGKDQSGNKIGSGVYFYKLRTESTNQVRKMLMLK